MNLSHFKYLDLPLQAVVICQQGQYLAEREQDQVLIVLYQLYDFYAEVYFQFRSSQLLKIISFHSDVLLEPYLSKMRISELVGDNRVVLSA
jgi:hypothetical protein